MTLTVQQYLVAKDGNPSEQNDDAAAADPLRRRFAVSDGATNSGFSRIWSRLLVDQFVTQSDCEPNDWQAWLPTAQQRWLAELEGVEIPWYGEKQFAVGSFATFLGLVVPEPNSSTTSQWHAVAVGDSCLFHTRDSVLLKAFPLEKSSQFDSFPRLVGSRSAVAEIADKRARTASGEWQPQDRLWLMSDALSAWCLAESEADRAPWKELDTFLQESCEELFSQWIEQLRTTNGLHNDDVTLVAIDL